MSKETYTDDVSGINMSKETYIDDVSWIELMWIQMGKSTYYNYRPIVL